MEENESNVMIPYSAYENECARHERQIKKLYKIILTIVIVSILTIFLSNLAWLMAWMQYDYSSYELTTDGGGDAYYSEQTGGILTYGDYTGEEEDSQKP